MSSSSFTASLGDIMLITIQKVVETSGAMLGAVQLGMFKVGIEACLLLLI